MLRDLEIEILARNIRTNNFNESEFNLAKQNLTHAQILKLTNALHHNRHITAISFDHNNFNTKCMLAVFDLLRINQHIKFISLYHTLDKATPDTDKNRIIEHLADILKHNHTLEKLALSENGLHEAELQPLLDTMSTHNTTITYLDLSQGATNISEKSLGLLANIQLLVKINAEETNPRLLFRI